MSERDELAGMIATDRPDVWKSMLEDQHMAGPKAYVDKYRAIADAILAANYRKVPDDCVVVKRGEFIKRMNYAIACEWDFGTDNPVEHFQEAITESLLDDEVDWEAALPATRHGEES